ncbi:MAG: hypothetical protein J2P18_02120 [Nocardia sp.]|nr:hypothetical protein [Nocardia sp.]
MREPQQAFVAEIEVSCSHCEGQWFRARKALLNTRGLTLYGLDWANRSADVYECAECGHLEWFAHREIADEGDDAAEDTECLSCGVTIPAGETSCRQCGWSYA